MFCHTSVQAINHCFGSIFGGFAPGPEIDAPSGIFLKRCLNETCGLKLQLKPLHTLVVTAVYLGELGSDGENLFGMVACLLSLLGGGASPLLKADVSLEALLGSGDNPHCTHSELDPLELAHKVPQEIIAGWPRERRTGWMVFCKILELSQHEWNLPSRRRRQSMTPDPHNEESSHDDRDQYMDEAQDIDNPDEDETHQIPAWCDNHGDFIDFFGYSRNLRELWAAVQMEMLTYRRLTEEDPWISETSTWVLCWTA